MMMDTEQEARRRKEIKKYKKKLIGITKSIDGDIKIVASILVERIAYLSAYMDEIQENTIKSGVVVQYNNGGGQSGYRISPEVHVYTAYAKQLTASIKQLQGFLTHPKEEADVLQEFAERFTVKNHMD